MALFKLRKARPDSAASASPGSSAVPAESIEAMRRRARHRLIGASVLVLLGVVGFPLLFDTQPRPIPVDIPIQIPDRNKVNPLPMPAAASPSVQAPVAAAAPRAQPVPPSGASVSGSIGSASPPAAAAPAKAQEESASSVVAKVEPKAGTKPESKPEPKPEPGTESKPEPKAESKPQPAAAARSDDGARAQALLEGKAASAAAESGRFIVQVGAFSDAGKAHEMRIKVERAGLKTYTQVAETKEGKLIRVRVGPFATRAEADRAAEKLKGLDLQARILTL